MALSAEQQRIAQSIISTGRRMGASKRDIQIALATARTESNFSNSAVGDGGLAIGVFQQHPSWAPTASRRDAAASAQRFYTELFKVKNRNRMQPWEAAQAVQRSATSDGSNYRASWSSAQNIYGGVSAGSVGTTQSVSGIGGTVAPQLSATDLAESYGFAMAFLKSHKDVYKQFQKAVAQNWAPDKFVAELKNTGWWKTTANSVRQYQIQKAQDPATLNQRRQALTAQLRDSAAQVGAALSNKQLQRVTENALMFGWNDSQIRDTLGQYVHTMNGIYNGQTGTDVDALKQTAWRNGVRLSTATMDTWAKQMAKGNVTPQYYQDSIRKMAKTVAPGFAQELDSGMDLYDIANPYIEAKAKLLQIDPAKVDLFDTDIRGALSAKDTQGKPTSKSLWEFEQDMRNKPEYLRTDTARDQAYGIGHQVLRDMGLIGA